MKLSVVILSFNVKDLLAKAIKSIYGTYKSPQLQVIVVDNASTDGSAEMVAKRFSKVKLVVSKTNAGFSKGNNLARKYVDGDVVLFLNPDTEIKGKAIEKCLEILEDRKDAAAVTCKVMLPNGKLDYSCHRGLPTTWNTFTYWSGLSMIFPKSRIFSGYTATYLDINKSSYIDCASGVFLMVRKSALDKIGWWDEDYWWNGEDIELCYQLKKAGYKIWYEAGEEVIHYKGSSSGLWSTSIKQVARKTKIKSAKSAASAMRIFISKHSKELGPAFLMKIVLFAVNMLERYRIWKINKGFKYA